MARLDICIDSSGEDRTYIDISIRALNDQIVASRLTKSDSLLSGLERGEKDKEKRYPVTDKLGRRRLPGTLVPFVFSPFGAVGKQADKFLEKLKEEHGGGKLRLFKCKISAKFVMIMARRLRRGAGLLTADMSNPLAPGFGDPTLRRYLTAANTDVKEADDPLLKRNISMLTTASVSSTPASKKRKSSPSDAGGASPPSPRDVPGQFFLHSYGAVFPPPQPV